MAKPSNVFVCNDCGGESLRWSGQCPHCKAWNTLQEFKVVDTRRSGGHARPAPTAPRKATPITQVEPAAEPRFRLAWKELNRVLGGGVVPGSVVLVGGEPGVGKSTLLMQAARQAAERTIVLYATGEESLRQVRMRAERLDALHERILLLAENEVDGILAAIEEAKPAVAVVDSIQTVYDPALESGAGSVSQVRESAARLMRVAKETGTAVVLVGHVTKEGNLAGPRVLEHMVDTVLYLEGDRGQGFRVLRATKNRFGSTDEIGIFSMGEAGLEEVEDPSQALLSESSLNSSGTVVLAAVEGTRPLLVELQALVIRRSSENTALPGRRAVNGLDANRLHMITAILEKRLRTPLSTADIYVSVAGGLRIVEPAADLGLALCLLSSHHNEPLPGGTVAVGELGLTGEVRRVGQLGRRIAEAARRGLARVIIPRGSQVEARYPGLELIEAGSLAEAVAILLPEARIPLHILPGN